MRKVKCINGHFFDVDRFSSCPSCGAASVDSPELPDKSTSAKSPVTTPLLPPVGSDRPEDEMRTAPGAGKARKKVKCINGHFFDADRFSNCPSCGADPIGPTGFPDKGAFTKPQVTQLLHPPAGLEPTTSQEDMPLAPSSTDHYFPWGQLLNADMERDTLGDAVAAQDKNIIQSQQQAEQFNIEDDSIRSSTQPDKISSRGALVDAVKATTSKQTTALPKTTAFYDAGEVEPPVGWLVCIRGIYTGRAFECKAGRSRIGRNLDMDICLSEDSSISRDVHAAIIYEPKKRIFYLQAGTSSGLTYHNGNLIFDHEELHAYDKVELGKTEFLFFPLCGENFTWDDYMEKG